MLLETTRFGELEVTDKDIYHFRKGLPGFEQVTKFVVVEVEDSPFMYLQAVEQTEVSFIAASPFDFFESYEFTLSPDLLDDLDITEQAQVKIISIVNVRDELVKATVNLGAPIILNTSARRGAQYILPDGGYSVHQSLFGQMEARKGGQ